MAEARNTAKRVVAIVIGEQYQALRGLLRLVDIEPIMSDFSLLPVVSVVEVGRSAACGLAPVLLIRRGSGDLS